MLQKTKHIAVLLSLGIACSCSQNKKNEMGSYAYDTHFFKEKGVEFIELADQNAKVLIVPGYQGRVMTSTAGGDKGNSYGWINYKLIESGEINPQFNPVGGEERFWLGPEGGAFSYYFEKGKEQVYENWKVPAVIDTDTYDVVEKSSRSVKFTKSAVLKNASETGFKIDIERVISLLDRKEIEQLLHIQVPEALHFVAYQTDNKITNAGTEPWIKESGVPSIWLLGMFNPTPTTTVFIPYQEEAEGVIVNDEYFGKVPADRLIAQDGMLYFKIDGKHRSKIGMPAARAKNLCGSYDSEKKVLTLVSFTLPDTPQSYVNGQWGEQEDAFNGDVINAYNDGPVADGSIMGPFYEIETSSPGAELAPQESMRHVQRVIHIQGDEQLIAVIFRTLFSSDLNTVITKFK